MSDYAELRKIIGITLRWLWLLILITLAAAALGYGVSQRQSRVYEATTTIMVGHLTQATELSRSDLMTNEILAQTYSDMALRQPILQGVIDTLDLSGTWRKLRKQVNAQIVEGTQLIQITAEADSTELAQTIADEVARQLILLSPTAVQNEERSKNHEFVKERLANLQTKIELGQKRLDTLETAMVVAQTPQKIQELQSAMNTLEELVSKWESNYTQMLTYIERQSPSTSLTVVEPAQANPRPIRPRTDLNTLVASAVGFLFALGLVLLLEFKDDTLKSTDDLGLSLGLTALGAINNINGKHEESKLLLSQNPASPMTEAYRIVRSNIEFKTADQPVKSIVVTSPEIGEGKSITAANLGIIMAYGGSRTIVVDANLRQPAQHRLFQIANSVGLAEAISSPELDLNSLLVDTKVHNLQVLPSGKEPLNPAELLDSSSMQQVLANLGQMADVIICDSPSALGLTDASILANRTDGVVLVVEAGQTHLGAAQQTISNLQQADANLIGVILNRGDSDHGKYYRSARRIVSLDSATRMRKHRWQWLPF